MLTKPPLASTINRKVSNMEEMKFDELFNMEPLPPETMDSNDFFAKTQHLLNRISTIYNQGWQSKPLKDEEFPEESICDKCTGYGKLHSDIDEERECAQDKEQGWCYYRFCDYEQVGMDLEVLIEDVYGLLSIDELETKKGE